MNILNLLSKKRDIVGVEISDQIIRVAYFYPRSKHNRDKNIPPYKIILKEIAIPEKVISNGVITNKELLGQILKKIWKDEGLKKNYAVISIPEEKIYSHQLSVPRDVSYSKLPEAVSLAIDFQIPLKKDGIYSSWELNQESKESNQILVSVIPKEIIDAYTEVLEKLNINILAIEPHLSSIIRVIGIEDDKSIILKENHSSITISYFKNRFLKFSRTIPREFTKGEDSIKQEVENIRNSFEFEEKGSIKVELFKDSKIIEKYNKYPEVSDLKDLTSNWIISIGALDRGEILQGQDKQICLLPVDMAKAYSYQKAKIFTTLIRNMIIVISLFFIFTFIASYLFMSEIRQKIGVRNSTLISPISGEIANKEILIKKVNSLTEASSLVLKSTVNWSVFIDEIKNRTIEGITISNLSIPSVNDRISMAGVASNREVLNKFKKSLQDSIYLTEIELPITNLEQKLDIPFSISFKIKDPSALYYK